MQFEFSRLIYKHLRQLQSMFQQHVHGSSRARGAMLNENRVRGSAQHRFIDTGSASSTTRCVFTASTCTASLHKLSLQLQCINNQHIIQAHAVDTIPKHSKTHLHYWLHIKEIHLCRYCCQDNLGMYEVIIAYKSINTGR